MDLSSNFLSKADLLPTCPYFQVQKAAMLLKEGIYQDL